MAADGSRQAVDLCDAGYKLYVGSLGGPQALQLLCESNGQFNGSLCDSAMNSTRSLNDWPLRGAVPYKALRIRCDKAENLQQTAILCDHGVDPPLAVDRNGKYLGRSDALFQDGVIFFGAPPQNVSVVFTVYFLLGTLVLVVLAMLSHLLGTVNLLHSFFSHMYASMRRNPRSPAI